MSASARGAAPWRRCVSCFAIFASGLLCGILGGGMVISFEENSIVLTRATKPSTFSCPACPACIPSHVSSPPVAAAISCASLAPAARCPSPAAAPATSPACPASPKSSSSEVTVPDATAVTAAAAMARMRSSYWKQCGYDLYGAIRSGGSRSCTLPELGNAMRRGSGEVATPSGSFIIDECAFNWYDPTQVCDMMESRDVVLITVGDSLVRHLTNGLYMVAQGDAVHGTMRWWSSNLTVPDTASREYCTCANAFEDRYHCRFYSVSYLYDGEERLICPTWTRPRIVYAELWNTVPDAEFEEAILRKVVTGRNARSTTVAYISQGNHFGMHIPTVMHSYSIFVNMTRAYGMKPVFGTVHTQDDPRKPQDQRMDRVLPLNDAMRQLGTNLSVPVFETQSFTLNAYSFDGTHYDSHVNVPLAQMLLNYVDALSAEDGE